MAKHAPHADPFILPQGAIIEFVGQGGYVKVSAVDPVTFEEVSIVGDPAVAESELSRLVVRKLERMVERKHADAVARRRGRGGANRRPDPPSGWDL
ncbi:hypothetical protein KAJ83_02940 [Marivibrio halodurans]|uniref:DUF6898 domain-containing protein n=1 Tax=Marivibrio halodurans TaxID=2039722 RepID=A0A8J7SK27_9PROT|nr:hypothetical protein [Marivibrio halodurans]MBP5855948.1 hypothetical protein [Marivibrio halodurans]